MENVPMHNINIEEKKRMNKDFHQLNMKLYQVGQFIYGSFQLKKKPVYVIFLHYVINDGNYLN